jgi:transposase
LKVSRQSVSRWYQQWQAGGLRALRKTERAGRPPRLTPAQLVRVEKALLKGACANGYPTELWTLRRVAEVIERVTGVGYHQGHVWRILRGLGWSRQKPARRAAERDEKRIEAWIKEDWPALKRGRSETGPGSSSRTKAASR